MGCNHMEGIRMGTDYYFRQKESFRQNQILCPIPDVQEWEMFLNVRQDVDKLPFLLPEKEIHHSYCYHLPLQA